MTFTRAIFGFAIAGLAIAHSFIAVNSHAQTETSQRPPTASLPAPIRQPRGREWLLKKFSNDPTIAPILNRENAAPHYSQPPRTSETIPTPSISAPHRVAPTTTSATRQILQWRVQSSLHNQGVFPLAEPPGIIMTPEISRSLNHPAVQAACQQIDNTDWSRVVRSATKSFTVRSFNSKSLADRANVPDSVRVAVRDAIVGEINRSVGNRKRLQHVGNAIEAGVEDAIVEAFNYSANNNLSAIPKTPSTGADECLRINVVGGCIVVDEEIIPLASDGSYQLIQRTQRSPSFELWRDGRQVFANCLYAQYYRDAMKLRDKYSSKDQQP